MSSIDTFQPHVAPQPEKALLADPGKAPRPTSQMIVDVARDHGLSPIKQFRQMVTLQRKAGISFREYYSGQHFRSDLTMEQKLQFVGEKGNYKLNLRLSPPGLGDKRSLIRDKVLYTTMLKGMGLPTTETQAVAHPERGFGGIPALRTAAEVARFLKETAVYPLFVKPLEGSKSVGSALITSCDTVKGLIEMGNGRSFDVDAFAEEVITDYPDGFAFQNAVVQHKDMRDVTGPAVGTLRLVTVIEDGAPRVLYAVWKIPSPKAMSDNFWQTGSMLGAVDHITGKVQHAISGTGLDRQILQQHPVSGKTFAGFQIPDWDKLCDLAKEGHALFPEHGVFGWDIAVSEDGPLIIECNSNPFQMLYQLTYDRGILNEEFSPVFDKVAARTADLVQSRMATAKAKRKEKLRA